MSDVSLHGGSLVDAREEKAEQAESEDGVACTVPSDERSTGYVGARGPAGEGEAAGEVRQVRAATDSPFLPSRFVRRDIEVLASRLLNPGGEGNGKPGDWEVVDDRGRKSIVTNDDFAYEYKPNDSHGGPGKINILLPGINALGCRAVLLSPGEVGIDAALNEFFERPEHFGFAIAHTLPLPSGSLLVFVTRPLTQREIDERQEVAMETRATIDRKHQEALEQQAKAIEVANAAEVAAKEIATLKLAEDLRFIELGKRHDKNCRKEK